MIHEDEPLEPAHLLRMWYLATHGGEAWQAQIRPPMDKSDRMFFVQHNLMNVIKENPRIRLEISDYGWRYLARHMTDPIEEHTQAAGLILNLVFKALKDLMDVNDISLNDVFPIQKISDPQWKRDLWVRLCRVYGDNFQKDGWVFLRDIRPAFPDMTRRTFDYALRAWLEEDKIEFISLDPDPEEEAGKDKTANADADSVGADETSAQETGGTKKGRKKGKKPKSAARAQNADANGDVGEEEEVIRPTPADRVAAIRIGGKEMHAVHIRPADIIRP